MSSVFSDPVILKVIWDRLIAITNEQAAALIRTAFTPIVRDAEDLSAGLFDRRGRLVAQSVTGTPGHINSMATSMQHFVREFPPDTLEPGDVLITNDPWITCGHLNDLTVATPAFRGTSLVGFFANTCHALDIGGRPLSADARDVHEEGLYIPIMKLFHRGTPDAGLFKILRANVRTPDAVVGDLMAQVACNDGGRKLVELLREFTLDDLERASDVITDRAEDAMRRGIECIPDGTYAAEGWADGYDEPVRLSVHVEVQGSTLTVDFTGSAPESRHGINVVLNYTLAYTNFAAKAAIRPDVPNNEGSFRPVSVVAPPGTILNARYPAPVAARAVLGHFIPGLIFQALGPALGPRALAGGADAVWLVTVHGRSGAAQPYAYTYFINGGMGARRHKDGLAATGFPSGVAGCPVEVTENLTPLLICRRELRPDSGGPGRQRGGLGQVVELAARAPTPYSIAVTTDRTRFPAPGIEGGKAGAPARTTLDTGQPLNLKQTHSLPPERRVMLALPGGGGFGDPLARNPRMVLLDVLNGYVSLDQAREAYGVVITQHAAADEIVLMPEDFEIDEAATEQLRRARSRSPHGGPA
jgi:N-methylhydantoinase B